MISRPYLARSPRKVSRRTVTGYHNDMDTCSLAAAARALGTSAPRVRRAVDRLGMPVERAASGVFRLTQQQVDELARELGVTVSVPGLSRVEAKVLAALSRSPRGVASVREAGRRAGVSPTATARALARLTTDDLVTQTPVMLARGRAAETAVYRVRFGSPQWLALAPVIARVRVPARFEGGTPREFLRTCCTYSGTLPPPSSMSRARHRSSPGG